MRQSKQTADEIFATEKAVDDRRQSRSSGFSMMSIRDQGAVRLNNGVLMRWPTKLDKVPLVEGEARSRGIPDDHFVLEVNGKTILFEADEFRKWLRWA